MKNAVLKTDATAFIQDKHPEYCHPAPTRIAARYAVIQALPTFDETTLQWIKDQFDVPLEQRDSQSPTELLKFLVAHDNEGCWEIIAEHFAIPISPVAAQHWWAVGLKTANEMAQKGALICLIDGTAFWGELSEITA